MTDRIEKMRTHLAALPDDSTCMDLSYSLALQSLRTSTEKSTQKRRALAQAHILESAPLEIHPYELIAGSVCGLCANNSANRTRQRTHSYSPHEILDSVPWSAANHVSLNYGRVARQGLGALAAQIDDQCHDPHLSCARRDYFESAAIVVLALESFILRTADALKVQAAQEETLRRMELEELAEICQHISSLPPRSFHEALQLVWLLHLAAHMCSSYALSFARFDQYMYPWYARDIGTGKISRSRAKELVSCFWLKMNEPKLRATQSMTFGGITSEGEDAANELTALCLEVTAELHLPNPAVGLRIHEANPSWLYDKAVGCIQEGTAVTVLNDAIWIPNLQKLGYSSRKANDYYNMGRTEIMLPNAQPRWGFAHEISFPELLHKVFSGSARNSGSLDSYEEFYNAYILEMAQAVETAHRAADEEACRMKGSWYDPLASLMIDGCLERGRDMYQDGSTLGTHWSVYGYGLEAAGEILWLIRKYVYKEKRIPLEQFIHVYESKNAHKPTKQFPSEMAAQFGNDEDEVDAVIRELLCAFTNMVLELNTDNSKDKYVSTLPGRAPYAYYGDLPDANSDVRDIEPLFLRGRISSKGPTAFLNSVLKLDHSTITGGCTVDFHLSPYALRYPGSVKSLLRAYIRDGGPQIQSSMANASRLKYAQKYPEKCQDLIVRLGPYHAYFVRLDRAVQDRIIAAYG